MFFVNDYNKRWAHSVIAAPTAMLLGRLAGAAMDTSMLDIARIDLFVLASTFLASASLSRVLLGLAFTLYAMGFVATLDDTFVRPLLNSAGLLIALTYWFLWRRKNRDEEG